MKAVSSAHEAYVTGDYGTSLKRFRKQKHKTPYECLLMTYMGNAKTPCQHAPGSIVENLTELYKKGMPKSGLKEALMIAPAMLLFGLGWAPLFLAIYFLFYFVEKRQTVYLLGSLSNVPSIMLPAMLMGLITIYFHSKKFYRLFFRKRHQKLVALDQAARSPRSHKFMKLMRTGVLVGSVIFLFLTVHQNIKLTQDGFYDNINFWDVQGAYYQYEDVARLRYREQTPSGYDFTMDFPSYVIELKDGREIDPCQFGTCEETFLNVFREKGVPVETPHRLPLIDTHQFC